MSSPSPFSERKDKAQIEESTDFAPKFDENGLIPAMAIDATTKEPLMLAYIEIRTDCDQDTLILLVDQIGAGACHTGRGSCFYRKIVPGTPAALKFTQTDLSFDPSQVYKKS